MMAPLHNMAMLFLDSAGIDWSAMAAMLAIIVGLSSIVGTLITRMLVKPMIDKAVEKVLASMVTKETFILYETQDRREHDAMQKQLDAVFVRLNS
jgi:hypothetical protein